MKVKHIIALYLVGFGLFGTSTVFKFLHLMGATTLLLLSGVIIIIATILAIWKLFTSDYFEKFLNS